MLKAIKDDQDIEFEEEVVKIVSSSAYSGIIFCLASQKITNSISQGGADTVRTHLHIGYLCLSDSGYLQ